MAVSPTQFISDYADFCRQSMGWCCRESESEATRVFQILSDLVADLERRSKMSEKALNALMEMKDLVYRHIAEKSGALNLSGLVDELNALKSTHKELDQLINPIISCLQFQDRLRQNLENIGKSIAVWVAFRGSELQPRLVSPQELSGFGEQLIKCMTSGEERELVRKHISGLSAEVRVDTSILF